MMELSDYAIIIAFTTLLTTASTYVLLSRMRNELERRICDKIEGIFVRIGVLEAKHQND